MSMKRHTRIAAAPSASVPMSQLEFHDTWRSLWEQHVAWTRMTILSAAFGLPDIQQVSARLLQNATDMGAALLPIYGAAVAAQFAELIRNHLLIAIRLVSAAKQGDTGAAAQAEQEWYANADIIAATLASINPYLSQDVFRNMMHDHLALTKAEAVAILSGNYQESIALYDQIEKQAIGMADMISGSVMRQYPSLFR